MARHFSSSRKVLQLAVSAEWEDKKLMISWPVDKEDEEEPPVEPGVQPVPQGGAAPGGRQHQLEHIVQVAGQTPETAVLQQLFVFI